MAEKNKAAEAAQLIDVAKVHNPKDFAKVLEFFRYNGIQACSDIIDRKSVV